MKRLGFGNRVPWGDLCAKGHGIPVEIQEAHRNGATPAMHWSRVVVIEWCTKGGVEWGISPIMGVGVACNPSCNRLRVRDQLGGAWRPGEIRSLVETATTTASSMGGGGPRAHLTGVEV